MALRCLGKQGVENNLIFWFFEKFNERNLLNNETAVKSKIIWA